MNRSAIRTLQNPDVGLLLIRVMVGVVGMYHGSQKLFGLFGGGGIRGTAGAMEQMGLPLPMLSAILAGAAECFGGLLVAIGLRARLAALPYAFTMFVAAFYVHGHAFGAQHNGMEYPLTLGVVLIGLAMTGPGRLTFPNAIRRIEPARASTPRT
jgi:putative oxidoreductase